MRQISLNPMYRSLLLMACVLFGACTDPAATPTSNAEHAQEQSQEQPPKQPLEQSTMPTSQTVTQVADESPANREATNQEVPAAIMDLVLADFLAQTGATTGEYAIRSAQQREWPDGGMGCAPLDEVHTQIPVSGYQVVILHQGARYDYRIDEHNQIRLCQLLPNRRSNGPPTQ